MKWLLLSFFWMFSFSLQAGSDVDSPIDFDALFGGAPTGRCLWLSRVDDTYLFQTKLQLQPLLSGIPRLQTDIRQVQMEIEQHLLSPVSELAELRRLMDQRLALQNHCQQTQSKLFHSLVQSRVLFQDPDCGERLRRFCRHHRCNFDAVLLWR